MSTHTPIHGDATLNAIGETAKTMEAELYDLSIIAYSGGKVDERRIRSLLAASRLILKLAKAAAQ